MPSELIEAARVDGASMFQIFWHVGFPAARPAAAMLGMFTFIAAWTDFFWPLVVLTPEDPTVQTALVHSGQRLHPGLLAVADRHGHRDHPAAGGVRACSASDIIGGIMQGAVKS